MHFFESSSRDDARNDEDDDEDATLRNPSGNDVRIENVKIETVCLKYT